MKKKGYTLIELIAVMSILAILLGSGFTIVSVMRQLKEDAEFQCVVGEISSILSYGKSYCRKYRTDGEITIDTYANKITFRNTKLIIKSVKLPDKVVVAVRGVNSTIINVNEEGYLKKACNIEVTYGKRQKVITIAVGVDKVTVKSEQEIVSEIEESE
ncbi:MAG: type II secretion system protein [Clostridium sp.]